MSGHLARARARTAGPAPVFLAYLLQPAAGEEDRAPAGAGHPVRWFAPSGTLRPVCGCGDSWLVGDGLSATDLRAAELMHAALATWAGTRRAVKNPLTARGSASAHHAILNL